jgi:hypothetical protein
MTEEERRELWAAALGVPEDELYAVDPQATDDAATDEERLRRVG